MSVDFPRHWSLDPLEVDRTLEEQLPPGALTARRAELGGDAALRARLEPRRRFLGLLGRAGDHYRAHLGEDLPVDLEPRVRVALGKARGRSGRLLRWARAAAALLVVGLGAALLWPRDRPAEAMPPEVLKAAEAARGNLGGPGSGPDAEREQLEQQSPLLREGELKVRQVVREGADVVAKLYRPEDLPSVGYVAVAERGARAGPDIGMTDLGDVVVFDLVYGRQRHYLAVSSRFLAEQRILQPGRESCAACHNRSRDGEANPHNIVKRSWASR